MPRDAQGNPVASFGRAKLNDDIHSNSTKAVNPKSRPAGHQPDPDAEMKDESPEDIKDVVQMHGPATEVTHKFDEATGKHHVHSKHGGGAAEHHSYHESHAAAHAHMGHAMGVSAEHEKGESKEYEAGEHEGAKEMSIPGLRG